MAKAYPARERAVLRMGSARPGEPGVPQGIRDGNSTWRFAKMNLTIWPAAVSGRRQKYFDFVFVQANSIKSVKQGLWF